MMFRMLSQERISLLENLYTLDDGKERQLFLALLLRNLKHAVSAENHTLRVVDCMLTMKARGYLAFKPLDTGDWFFSTGNDLLESMI